MEEVGHFLFSNETENVSLIGRLENHSFTAVLLVAVKRVRTDEVVMAACEVVRQGTIIQEPLLITTHDCSNDPNFPAVDVLVDVLAKQQHGLARYSNWGIIVPKLEGKKLAMLLNSILQTAGDDTKAKQLSLDMEQRVYKLVAVNQESLKFDASKFEVKQAIEANLPLCTEWWVQFLVDAHVVLTDPETMAKVSAASAIRSGRLFLLFAKPDNSQSNSNNQHQSEPVCMAGIARETKNVSVLGPVFTPTEHRRKGYASICVAQLSQNILDSGKLNCALLTDLSNPTSNKIYQTIGYEAVADWDHYMLA